MRIRMTAAAVLAGTALLTCAGTAAADAGASGVATGSPGVLSGNVVQIPIDLGLNLCGDSVGVLGALNPAAENACANQ
ncbi:chaplin [Streptomyces sp. NPDC046985]|uniref:chaplin n=1 Tax=Streptomyces sp. NPDC046985 TaxID=3155377 RepID=UPI0034101B9C